MPPVAHSHGIPSAISPPLLMQRALGAYQRGDLGEAERLCRSLLDARADHFEALYLLAIVAGRSGRTQAALDLLEKAAAANPASADAHYNRGVALGELGRHAEALPCYERAIALRPDFADAHFNRGVTLADLARLDDAIASYDHALALDPQRAEACTNRGVALRRLGRHADALASFERAVALRPRQASAHNNLGSALGDLGRHDEALASFERALALEPGYAEAWNNRSLVLADLERYDEALAGLERAIALRPDYVEAWYNRGNMLRELRRYADAIASFERAIALRPEYADAHWNLADLHLLLGDFARGWSEYEWRWKLARHDRARRDFAQPLWLGDTPLRDRTILLHAELGLGDTLLFCRYAADVAELGGRVVLEVQPPLVRLLAGLGGIAEIVPRGAPLPAVDCHCPLMSLPLAFRTDLRTVPARVSYVRSDPALVAHWRERLGAKTKPRIGVVWSGSVALKNDQRSMTLAEMLPLVGGDVHWVSLQKEVRADERPLLLAHPEIRHCGDELGDFADTAALVELMDLVVTIDTSVANLAGAMGKEVWIMLPANPHDWRWMLDREDSLWYPTARLFRQQAQGDWAAVVRRVGEALARRFDAGGSAFAAGAADAIRGDDHNEEGTTT